MDAGHLDAERFKTLDYASICVADAVAPPDLAVGATAAATARAQVGGRDVGMLLHGSLWFQGLDIWPAASYIAAHAGLRSVSAFDVQQRCNIGLGAVDSPAPGWPSPREQEGPRRAGRPTRPS